MTVSVFHKYFQKPFQMHTNHSDSEATFTRGYIWNITDVQNNFFSNVTDSDQILGFLKNAVHQIHCNQVQ